MPSRTPAWVAPVADAVCLGAFVVLGRSSHGYDAGAMWFLGVLWPFALGWYISALAVGLYRGSTPVAARWAVTVVGAVAIAMVLREVVQGRDGWSAFTWVSAGVIAALTGGWRLIATVVSRAGARRDALRGRQAR